MIGKVEKENDYCFWHFDASDFPVANNMKNVTDGTKFENEWIEKFTYPYAVQYSNQINSVYTVYGVQPLATGYSITDYYGGVIARFYPINFSSVSVAHNDYTGEYKGTAITVGTGYYEWNIKSGTNEYKSNIEQLTANALKELTSTAPANETVTLSSTGVSSFSSVYPLTFSESDELKAYVASSVKNNKVVLKQVTGDVPAGTGLILKGEANKEYKIPVATTASSLNETNLLVGTTVSPEVAASTENATNYVFGTLNNEQAFYKLETSYTSQPFKAYLSVSNDSPAKLNVSFDETTGVNIAEKQRQVPQSSAVYNIAGQRVSANYKGVAVKDAKKLLLKQ